MRGATARAYAAARWCLQRPRRPCRDRPASPGAPRPAERRAASASSTRPPRRRSGADWWHRDGLGGGTPTPSSGRCVMPTVGSSSYRAEVQRQTGPPRMVAGRGVDQQHVRPRRQGPHRLLHHAAEPQRQQAGRVRRPGRAASYLLRDDLVPTHHHRRHPRRVTSTSAPAKPAREAHPAATDEQVTDRRSPRLGIAPRRACVARPSAIRRRAATYDHRPAPVLDWEDGARRRRTLPDR